MNIKGIILSRFGWIYLLAFLGAIGVLGKILYLQFVTDDIWKEQAAKLETKNVVVPAHRGNILDSEGNPIACSVPAFNVYIDPSSESINKYFEAELAGLTRGLSSMFGLHSAAYYENQIRKARSKGNKRLLLVRRVTNVEAEAVKKLPLFKRGQFQGGLILDTTSIREYPFNRLAKRTIGYAQQGPNGKFVGLEGKFDEYLKGKDGERMTFRSSGGYLPSSIKNLKDPKDGRDIQSTLNMNYQDVAEASLEKLLMKENAKNGCVILMEVPTGEIKAMVNLTQNDEGAYVEDFNYAVGESLEPGSTFKLPSIMAALEEGSIDLDDTIDTYRGVYRVHDREIKDSDRNGYGVISVQRVFEKSSNIGTARIIEKCFKGREEDYIERLYAMGLKNKTGIEINGENAPYIKHPDDKNSDGVKLWSGVSLAFIAHGYEISLAPIQILTFYNAVANNGKMVAPRLVKAIKYQSHTETTFGPKVLKNSICSKETIAKAKTMLEGVVLNGTAKNLKTDKYKIAGKTGTAVINRAGGGYEDELGHKDYRASFVGYFPADKPLYSCMVVVSKPQIRKYGNRVAGDVFRDVADKVFATDMRLHSDIAESTWEPVGDAPALDNGKSVDELEIIEGIMPDVSGLSLMDALPILENAGLKVDVKGFGRVVSQSIEAGSRIRKGQRINLTMKPE